MRGLDNDFKVLEQILQKYESANQDSGQKEVNKRLFMNRNRQEKKEGKKEL